MGFDNLAGGQVEGSTRGKSTHIKFWNPRNAEVGEDIPEGNEHLHEQGYYDAVKELRNMYGPKINVIMGEFAQAAVANENGDPQQLFDLVESVTDTDE